jgi:hypothetical protein
MRAQAVRLPARTDVGRLNAKAEAEALCRSSNKQRRTNARGRDVGRFDDAALE